MSYAMAFAQIQNQIRECQLPCASISLRQPTQCVTAALQPPCNNFCIREQRRPLYIGRPKMDHSQIQHGIGLEFLPSDARGASRLGQLRSLLGRRPHSRVGFPRQDRQALGYGNGAMPPNARCWQNSLHYFIRFDRHLPCGITLSATPPFRPPFSI